jgi:L-alanine-DL-glutamate epimerase-like enolase superfamily enzyme
MPRVQDYVDEALRFRGAGWAAYKIHPRGVPKVHLEICAGVKDAVSNSMVLMLDSMWSYGYENAARVGLAIQEMGCYSYEDPLAVAVWSPGDALATQPTSRRRSPF